MVISGFSVVYIFLPLSLTFRDRQEWNRCSHCICACNAQQENWWWKECSLLWSFQQGCWCCTPWVFV